MFVKFKLKAQHTCLLACFSALDTGSLGESFDKRTLINLQFTFTFGHLQFASLQFNVLVQNLHCRLIFAISFWSQPTW